MTNSIKTKQKEQTDELNPYLDWARIVCRLHNKKKVKQTIKWWRSKKAKQIWGTKGARLRRNALKKILKDMYMLKSK
jgi:hypothetical protein